MASPYSQSGADLNPYAPSAVVQPIVPVAPQQLGGLNGLWRKGNLIVVHPQAVMPQICVWSGQKGDKPVKLKLAWSPPWLYLFGAIVVMFLQKKRELTPWLSQDQFDRRRKFQIAGCLAFAGGLGLAVLAFVFAIDMRANESPLAGLTFAAAMISGLVGVVLLGPWSTLLRPKKITDQYALIAGAKEPFLRLLEEFPHLLP